MSNFSHTVQDSTPRSAEGSTEPNFFQELLAQTTPEIRLNFLLKLKENGFSSPTEIEESSEAVSGLLRQALQEG